MYSEEIEKLIELALADGEITEKEKQILFKRAEVEGIDLDEFEMVLEVRLYEKTKDKVVVPPLPTAAPKSDKFGDVKKCPACGAIVESFSTRCSDCGHSFDGIKANVSVNKLFEKLVEVENSRSSNVLSQFGSVFIKHFGADKVTNQKKSLISNYPIPNTKEDILEFLSLAVPKAKLAGNFFTSGNEANKEHNDFVPTWKSKCEQIIMKARFSMKEDKKTLDEIEYYARQIGVK